MDTRKISQANFTIDIVFFPSFTTSTYLPIFNMRNEQERREMVATALSWTKTTALTPSLYETALLQQYVEGVLTIDRVIELLEENNEKLLSKG